jgi:hypothetical protein
MDQRTLKTLIRAALPLLLDMLMPDPPPRVREPDDEDGDGGLGDYADGYDDGFAAAAGSGAVRSVASYTLRNIVDDLRLLSRENRGATPGEVMTTISRLERLVALTQPVAPPVAPPRPRQYMQTAMPTTLAAGEVGVVSVPLQRTMVLRRIVLPSSSPGIVVRNIRVGTESMLAEGATPMPAALFSPLVEGTEFTGRKVLAGTVVEVEVQNMSEESRRVQAAVIGEVTD